jgi:hypothetical protein
MNEENFHRCLRRIQLRPFENTHKTSITSLLQAPGFSNRRARRLGRMDRFRSSFQRLNPNASRWGLGERNASHQPPKLESARANLGVTGIAALDQDVVIHTPILATTGDEVTTA